MFIDYYAVLEIEETATLEEIKAAFKKQAIKWHPDKNIGVDTTIKMQEINEAYVLLKDTEARERYDKEYQTFKQYQSEFKSKEKKKEKQQENKEYSYEESSKNQSEKTYEYYEYEINDDILKKWMNTAKKQAVDLAKQTIEDFRGMTSAGVKGASKGCFQQFLAQIIIGVIFTLTFLLYKACNN